MVTIRYECEDGYIGYESFENKDEFDDFINHMEDEGDGKRLTQESINNAYNEFLVKGLD